MKQQLKLVQTVQRVLRRRTTVRNGSRGCWPKVCTQHDIMYNTELKCIAYKQQPKSADSIITTAADPKDRATGVWGCGVQS